MNFDENFSWKLIFIVKNNELLIRVLTVKVILHIFEKKIQSLNLKLCHLLSKTYIWVNILTFSINLYTYIFHYYSPSFNFTSLLLQILCEVKIVSSYQLSFMLMISGFRPLFFDIKPRRAQSFLITKKEEGEEDHKIKGKSFFLKKLFSFDGEKFFSYSFSLFCSVAVLARVEHL